MTSPDHSPAPPSAVPLALVESIFAADAALDSAAFGRLLTQDVSLRLGSAPPIQGHAQVLALVTGLFGMMRAGLEHRLLASWQTSGTLAYEATVTYRLKDGRDLVLPYANVLRLADTGLVQDYRIYIDLTPLHQGGAVHADP